MLEVKVHRIDLERAKWQVEHLTSWLVTHRAIPLKTEDWGLKEGELISRLQVASEELAAIQESVANTARTSK